MRVVALLNGQITETEIRRIVDLPPQAGEDDLTRLFDRGLIREENGKLIVASRAWTDGHHRSCWLDRLGGQHASELLADYIRDSKEAEANAERCWTDLAPYFPGRTMADVLATPAKREGSKRGT